MADPILKIQNLEAYYGDFQALFGINCEVNKGEIIAIIGANGAGKTTLMRAITGLLKSEADMVQWRGSPVGALRADQVAGLGIAMVPEGRQLFPSLSVEENLKIGGQVGRSGAWNLEAVFELFPILKERRNVARPQPCSGGTTANGRHWAALEMSNPDLAAVRRK
ncbi:UNVERIFIED_CONTAM: hypothetical protein GTU68_060539 [Idotea baltica]|nr:hypothetical protein [Idotea baltica]